jgi:hypothetical protein
VVSCKDKPLNEDQVKAIADLPSKEELMGQVAGALNSIATKLAVGINEVPTSLGRGINEIPSSLGRVVGCDRRERGRECLLSIPSPMFCMCPIIHFFHSFSRS